MATQKELTDIAVLSTEVKQLKQDIAEIKGDMKTLLDKFEKLDDRYPTRREVAVLRWVSGILLAFVSALTTVVLRGHIK